MLLIHRLLLRIVRALPLGLVAKPKEARTVGIFVERRALSIAGHSTGCSRRGSAGIFCPRLGTIHRLERLRADTRPDDAAVAACCDGRASGPRQDRLRDRAILWQGEIVNARLLRQLLNQRVIYKRIPLVWRQLGPLPVRGGSSLRLAASSSITRIEAIVFLFLLGLGFASGEYRCFVAIRKV